MAATERRQLAGEDERAAPREEAPPARLAQARRLLGRGLGHALTLLVNAAGGMGRNKGTQSAAGMSYYALFSVFPAAIVLAAVAGLILDDAGARADAVDYLFRELPVSTEDGRGSIDDMVRGVTRNAGALGLIGTLGLLISASALISATRAAIDRIFGGPVTRGMLRGKALDLLLALAAGTLFLLSFAATLVAGLSPDLGGGVLDAIESALTAGGALLPIAISALVFAVGYTVLPVERQRLRDIWPGVLVATLGYELLKRGFSFYLDKFADYSAIYGSLGAVIAFMFFVYLASLVFLFGAEIAALWPRVRAGELDSGDDDGEGATLGERLRELGHSLIARNPADRGGRR